MVTSAETQDPPPDPPPDPGFRKPLLRFWFNDPVRHVSCGDERERMRAASAAPGLINRPPIGSRDRGHTALLGAGSHLSQANLHTGGAETCSCRARFYRSPLNVQKTGSERGSDTGRGDGSRLKEQADIYVRYEKGCFVFNLPNSPNTVSLCLQSLC